jgi:hypothetical protein
MIYFDNLQGYATNSTHNIAEAIAGVLEVANVHTVQTRERAYLLANFGTSGNWERFDNYWVSDGVSIEPIAAAEAEGGVVIDVAIPDDGVILFGSGGTHAPIYGLGIAITEIDASTTVLRFVDQDNNIYQSLELPPASQDYPPENFFRVVLHEITTSRLEIQHKLIVVYRGLTFVAAQAFYRENDESTELVYLKNNSVGSPLTFRLIVQEFATPALEHSADPGETPQASFSRVTTGLAYKMAARYNRSVNLMRPVPGMSPVMDLSDYRDLSSVTKSFNYDKRMSRIRAVSAYPEAEFIDPQASDQAGGQFALTSNPNIITLEGAAAEAERVQNVSDSEAETIMIEGPSSLVLEPDDLVTVDNENWITTSGDRIIGQNGSHMSSVQLRKYTGAS